MYHYRHDENNKEKEVKIIEEINDKEIVNKIYRLTHIKHNNNKNNKRFVLNDDLKFLNWLNHWPYLNKSNTYFVALLCDKNVNFSTFLQLFKKKLSKNVDEILQVLFNDGKPSNYQGLLTNQNEVAVYFKTDKYNSYLSLVNDLKIMLFRTFTLVLCYYFR